jgi:hypothetical protein
MNSPTPQPDSPPGRRAFIRKQISEELLIVESLAQSSHTDPEKIGEIAERCHRIRNLIQTAGLEDEMRSLYVHSLKSMPPDTNA